MSNKKPIGHTLTPRYTPVHVADLVHLIVKETFTSQTEHWPYKFDPDFEKSNLAIVTSYNKNDKTYGKKPIIVISRGAQSSSQIIIGDRAAMNTFTHNKIESTLLNSTVEVRVLAKQPREVDVLSQHVFNILMLCRVILPAQLGITVANQISMSQVMPMEQDDQMYFTSISLGYQMQYLWKHFIPEIALDSILVKLNSIDVCLLQQEK